jgi:hypothetical protein
LHFYDLFGLHFHALVWRYRSKLGGGLGRECVCLPPWKKFSPQAVSVKNRNFMETNYFQIDEETKITKASLGNDTGNLFLHPKGLFFLSFFWTK